MTLRSPASFPSSDREGVVLRLHTAAAALSSPASEPFELRDASIAAHALFSELAGFHSNLSPRDETQDISLPSGMAISPRAAARCLTDHYRTTMFVRGVQAAIHDLHARFPGETLEVVYAGCGPSAPLCFLPLLVTGPDAIRFTLIDAHQRSMAAARQIATALRLEQNVRDYVCADAAAYRHPGDLPLHLVVTETMKRALEDEPQVAITANLVPQLARGGVLVPERISVSAYLTDAAKEFTPPEAPQRERIFLAELLEVSARTAHTLHAPSTIPVNIPRLPHSRYMLALSTFINVYGPHSLDENTSGISLPVWLRNIRAEDTPAIVEFTYQIGERPGFSLSSGFDASKSAH